MAVAAAASREAVTRVEAGRVEAGKGRRAAEKAVAAAA